MKKVQKDQEKENHACKIKKLEIQQQQANNTPSVVEENKR